MRRMLRAIGSAVTGVVDAGSRTRPSSVAGVADSGTKSSPGSPRAGDPGHRRALRACVFGFSLLLAPFLAAQPKEEPVIYPRGTSGPDAPATPAVAATSNSSLVLGVALLAAAGGWWFWLKRRGLVRNSALGGSRLSIAESRSLGSRQYLVVADYDGKKYLLGVCPGSIELLTPLEGGVQAPATKS